MISQKLQWPIPKSEMPGPRPGNMVLPFNSFSMDNMLIIALLDTLMADPLSMNELMDELSLFPKERKCYRSI